MSFYPTIQPTILCLQKGIVYAKVQHVLYNAVTKVWEVHFKGGTLMFVFENSEACLATFMDNVPHSKTGRMRTVQDPWVT